MVELANTVEYKDYKQLETVEVGDTITCKHKGIKIEVMKDKTEALIDEALEPTEIQNF